MNSNCIFFLYELCNFKEKNNGFKFYTFDLYTMQKVRVHQCYLRLHLNQKKLCFQAYSSESYNALIQRCEQQKKANTKQYMKNYFQKNKGSKKKDVGESKKSDNPKNDTEKNKDLKKQEAGTSKKSDILQNNDEHIANIMFWIQNEVDPSSTDLYYIAYIIYDEAHKYAPMLQDDFNERCANKDKNEKKLKKAVQKITDYFEIKMEYIQNLDDVFNCLNNKYWDYIKEVGILVDELLVEDLTDVLENNEDSDDDYKDVKTEITEKQCDLNDQRHAVYYHLMEKLNKIMDFYSPDKFTLSMIQFLDKDEKQFQIYEFMHYADWKLQTLFDSQVNCVVSLKAKVVKAVAESDCDREYYELTEKDIIILESVRLLKKHDPQPFIEYRNKHVCLCKCGTRCTKSTLMVHLNHRSNVKCRNSFTNDQMYVIKEIISKFKNDVDAERKRRLRQTEVYHIQLDNNKYLEKLNTALDEIWGPYTSEWWSKLQEVEDLFFDFIDTQRRVSYTKCRDWENELVKSISTLDNKEFLHLQIYEAMIYSRHEGYDKTSEKLNHLLHKTMDPYLGKCRTIKPTYCNCEEETEVLYVQGPMKPIPDDDYSIRLVYQDHAQPIALSTVQSELKEFLDFIHLEHQKSLDIISQKLISLKLVIKNHVKYRYSYELENLRRPVPLPHKTKEKKVKQKKPLILRPAEMDDDQWKDMLSTYKLNLATEENPNKFIISKVFTI